MNNTKRTNDQRIKRVAIAAMFTALAYIVMLVFHIKVQFLTFEFKDAVMTIGAMICGPVYAVIMSLVTSLIEFFTVSDTGAYGLIMNVVASVAFTLPASLIYKYKRSMTGALIGLVTSIFTMTALMLAANLFITPLYTGMDIKGVAELIPALLLPFNLTKAMLNAGVVILLYKPISTALKKAKLLAPTAQNGEATDRSGRIITTIIMTLISLILISISVMIFVIVLGGKSRFGL